LEQTYIIEFGKFHGCQHCIGLGIEVHIYISESLSEGTWDKDHMGTSYHPLTYCQSERTTQNLKDMFRDCVGWNFGKHLPIPEFAYIDSYLLSIKKNYYMRVIYGRPYSIPLCWTKVGEQYELELLIVQETVEQRTCSRIGFRKPMTSEDLCS